MVADQPQTIVWAFTLSSRTSIWRFMAIWQSGCQAVGRVVIFSMIPSLWARVVRQPMKLI